MNTELPREITQEEIETYHRDGVVLLEAMFDDDWIELLKQGLDQNCENPTHRARTWDRDSQGRTMFWDSQAWHGIEEYQKFIFSSPAAQLAGKLLQSKEINFFLTQSLCAPREPDFQHPGIRMNPIGQSRAMTPARYGCHLCP